MKAVTKLERPSWDEHFLGLARKAAEMSYCPRSQVGAVLVRNKRVLAVGHNGLRSGRDPCVVCPKDEKDIGHNIGYEDNCMALHAEENAAYLQPAIFGVAVPGSTLYCTRRPCPFCLERLYQVGIVGVVYLDEHGDVERMVL